MRYAFSSALLLVYYCYDLETSLVYNKKTYLIRFK